MHDEEFAAASRDFFSRVVSGDYLVLVSQLTLDELSRAPDAVRQVYEGLPPDCIDEVEIGQEATDLAREYIAAGALGRASQGDALHVAAATVCGADLILSWNFRHIVNFDRIRKFNSVNLVQGYRPVEIHSPLEVRGGDED